jgi:putative membrane protein
VSSAAPDYAQRFGLALRVVGRLVLRLSPVVLGLVAYALLDQFLLSCFEVPAWSFGTKLAAANGLVLGLLLAFRNRVAYDRWWEARRLWGELTNETRNLICKLVSYVGMEELTRTAVPLLLVAFPEALKRHLREGVRLQELVGFEKRTETPPHVPLYLAGRLIDQTVAWQKEGRIDGMTALNLDPHIRALVDVCGGCERIKHTGVSPSYVALLRFGLLINLLLAPWLILPELGFWGIPVLVVAAIFLYGLELVDSMVEEPFAVGMDHLDLDRYCANITASVRQVLEGEAAAKR